MISVVEFERLRTAAQQIQSEPPDPAKQLTDEQPELLKRAVAVLEDWYLLDENAKPFGEQAPLGEYVLRSRKTLLHGVSEIVEDVATLDALELEERVEQLKQRAGRTVLEPGLSAVGEPVAGRVVAVGRCGTRGGVR